MQREHVYERPGRSESRRRRRQRQFYRILAAIWLMAFVLGLLCGKLVFAKETGLLARAGAEPAAEESENDRIQAAEHDSSLFPGGGLVGGEGGGGGAAGDVLLHGPQHRVGVISVSGK